ncbi:MAG: sigma-54 dependent transcriptional regulator [Planctomycetales bacterium]|nr:sigma-54 dependent transcriptional regulator [Planctomycetales bacterium]
MLIFESSSMHDTLARARRFARSSGTVLISGESGTGKELLAQYLHDNSPRASRACVRVNCAAFHDGLAESELFGHEQGAFTGASRRHDGFLHAAGDGTLFLDEIGELPLPTQAKLLRVLEAQEYLRVGSTEVQRMNARIIAATNRDLRKEVAAGRFREDLFHRLDVLSLRLAPLRERTEDIPVLVNHFLKLFGQENETPVTAVSDVLMPSLMNFEWPGNVRQLRNVIHRACVESETNTICRLDFGVGSELRIAPQTSLSGIATAELPGGYQNMPLEDIERFVILSRIERCRGNKTEAAAELGVTARTLRNKLARWNELKKVS